MAGLGIVGLGAALINYRNAKKEYDTLEERYDGVMAAVETYEANKLNAYIESLEDRPNDIPAGLRFSTLLRVGNLVGKLMRCQTSLVISNISKQIYEIGTASAECKVLDTPVIVFSNKLLSEGAKQIEQKTAYNKVIRPGETVEIFMPAGISSLGDKMQELRDLICEANGKQLITSCPKTSISGGQLADINFQWRIKGENDWKICNMIERPGALRYCGEAYYPG